jgi:hypothetical protein
MRSPFVWATYASSALLAATLAAAPVQPFLDAGRERVAWFQEGQLDRLYGTLSERMVEAFTPEEILAFRAQMSADAGAEIEVIDERVVEENGLDVYVRRIRYERIAQLMDVIIAFNGALEIEGFLISISPDPVESPHEDYEWTARLTLPFTNAWTVWWGGRTLEENHHVVSTDLRFGADFVIERDGSRHSGTGETNDAYYCFSAAIHAPAAGRVVTVVDDIPDNEPGNPNRASAHGNHIVLDHGTGEYTVFAHLMAGSATVAAGDRVETGQPLAACGNSGDSVEPHLHVHAQNAAAVGEGEGLPLRFCDYVVDGEPTTCGEPSRGQVVRPR